MTRRASHITARDWPAWLVAVACLGLCPRAASAHLVSSGVGPFYDGVAHLLVSPEDLMAVLALALFGGLSGRDAARWLIVALPLAWLTALIIGERYGAAVGREPGITTVTSLVAGLLVAINPRFPRVTPAIVAVVLGGIHGYFNGVTMAATSTPWLSGLGIVVALCCVGLIAAAATSALSADWQRIGVRVLGSWIAAIGLLSLAWTLRPDIRG